MKCSPSVLKLSYDFKKSLVNQGRLSQQIFADTGINCLEDTHIINLFGTPYSSYAR